MILTRHFVTTRCLFIKAQRSGPSTLSASYFIAQYALHSEFLSTHVTEYSRINLADSFIIGGRYFTFGRRFYTCHQCRRTERLASSNISTHAYFCTFSRVDVDSADATFCKQIGRPLNRRVLNGSRHVRDAWWRATNKLLIDTTTER